MSDFSQLPPVQYETRDVDARSVGRTAVLLALGIVLSAFATWGFFAFLQHEDRSSRKTVPAVAQHDPLRTPPAPRLQEVPFDDIQELRRAEQAYLTQQYRWVEPGRVVRIPIAQAMRLYVERAAAGQAALPFTVAEMPALPAAPAAALAPAAGAQP